jgi:hypothetical protein
MSLPGAELKIPVLLSCELGSVITSVECWGKRMILGDSHGDLHVLDRKGKILNKLTLCGGSNGGGGDTAITALCCISNEKLAAAAGTSIVLIAWKGDDLLVVRKWKNAHSSFVKALVILGTMLYSFCKREGKTWNLVSGAFVRCFDFPSSFRIHSVSKVDMYGRAAIWVGGEDEVIIFSSNGSIVSKLLLPRPGEIVCMRQCGVGSVWIGIRHRRGEGSVLEWFF